MVLAQKCQKRPQGTLLKDVISANWTVTGDIAQSPNGLFADIENGGREQPDELRDGVGVDDHLGVVSGSGSNIRQGPRGFELKITREREVRDQRLWIAETGQRLFDCLDPEQFKAHLQHGMISLQEVDEAWHDVALDDLLDWGVFLLGEQLPEFRCSIQLACRVFRENSLDHILGQLIKEKSEITLRSRCTGIIQGEGTYVRYDGITTTRTVLIIGIRTAGREQVPPLGDVFLSFLLPDLHLLIFTSTPQLVGL